MFETHASFECRLPSPLRAPDTRQWVAMALNVEAPWFVLVSRTVLDAEEGIEGRRTTVLADEPSLHQVLSGPSAKSLLAMHCMLPGEGERRGGLADGAGARGVAAGRGRAAAGGAAGVPVLGRRHLA